MSDRPLKEKEIKEILDDDQGEFKRKITHAYFFGQFMLLHTLLKIRDSLGHEELHGFMEKKYKDIGTNNVDFVVQAEKLDNNIKKYYTDTMAMKAGGVI
jgi:hypothetical protein